MFPPREPLRLDRGTLPNFILSNTPPFVRSDGLASYTSDRNLRNAGILTQLARNATRENPHRTLEALTSSRPKTEHKTVFPARDPGFRGDLHLGKGSSRPLERCLVCENLYEANGGDPLKAHTSGSDSRTCRRLRGRPRFPQARGIISVQDTSTCSA